MTNRNRVHPVPQPTPRLALASGVGGSNRTPAALAAHARAAFLFGSAVEGQQALVAARLGVIQQTISKYSTGAQLVPLGDVLAAGPDVAARVLRPALEVIDQQPRSLEGPVAHEAVMLVARASQLVVVLSAAPLEVSAVDVLEGVVETIDEMADKLARLRARVLEVIRSKRGGGR